MSEGARAAVVLLTLMFVVGFVLGMAVMVIAMG